MTVRSHLDHGDPEMQVSEDKFTPLCAQCARSLHKTARQLDYVDTSSRSRSVYGLSSVRREARRGYKMPYLIRLVGKPTMWFPNRSDTTRAVQAQKNARGLKFWI